MTKCHFKMFATAFIAVLMLGVSVIAGTAPVYAAEYKTNLLVSPGDLTLGRLDPGKTYESEFKVKNIGTDDLHYHIYAAPYYEEGENGDQVYNISNNYTHLSEWITFSKKEGTLKPQSGETITFRVKVPADVAGGSQNAAIMVETNDSIEDTKVVSASGRVALILFSHVNGETNACGKIVDKNIPALLLSPPIMVTGRVENCGNLDLNVKYVMEVYPIFSDEAIYTNEENPMVLATLPETRRFTRVDWEGTPSFGLFKVKMTITYNDQTETLEKIVLVCPLWLIVLVIVFIGATIFWLVSRNRSRKIEYKINKSGE